MIFQRTTCGRPESAVLFFLLAGWLEMRPVQRLVSVVLRALITHGRSFARSFLVFCCCFVDVNVCCCWPRDRVCHFRGVGQLVNRCADTHTHTHTHAHMHSPTLKHRLQNVQARVRRICISDRYAHNHAHAPSFKLYSSTCGHC